MLQRFSNNECIDEKKRAQWNLQTMTRVDRFQNYLTLIWTPRYQKRFLEVWRRLRDYRRVCFFFLTKLFRLNRRCRGQRATCNWRGVTHSDEPITWRCSPKLPWFNMFHRLYMSPSQHKHTAIIRIHVMCRSHCIRSKHAGCIEYSSYYLPTLHVISSHLQLLVTSFLQSAAKEDDRSSGNSVVMNTAIKRIRASSDSSD